MDKQLTTEQKAFVSEHHNLIYSFLHSKHLSVDEWYGIAAIGLIKAAIYFEPSKGTSFSTYAYFVMNIEILQEIRKQNAVSRRDEKAILYYDSPAYDEEGNTCSFFDLMKDELQDTEDVALANVKYSTFISKLKDDKHVKILQLLELGYTQVEVGQAIGCSQTEISRIRRKLLDKYRNH